MSFTYNIHICLTFVRFVCRSVKDLVCGSLEFGIMAIVHLGAFCK